MSQISLDEVLAQINQLPPSEQERLYAALSSKLAQPRSPPRDRRVPSIVECSDYTREMQWLGDHQHEHGGQWVALKGDRLIAHGASAKEVYAAADAAGVEVPLVTRVDDPNAPPFAGV
jgi:hypothetical protein